MSDFIFSSGVFQISTSISNTTANSISSLNGISTSFQAEISETKKSGT
jgi:hypothetical protein